MNIYEVNKNLPRQSQIDKLNTMVLALEGAYTQGLFDVKELDQIYSDLILDRKFLRNQNIGHTLSTYTGWSHLKSETGYSIWKFTPTTYVYNANNKLYFDDKLLENRGQTSSESATVFDKVYLYNGDSGSGYIDNTGEAETEIGTQFAVMNSTYDYLYMGLSTTFTGIKFEWHTRGSNYTLKVEYFDGTSGVNDWNTLTINTNTLDDDTSNFESDGKISWVAPDDWSTTTVNSVSKYWIRISTTTTPSTTAQVYYIIPYNNVPALLALSATQIQDEDWAWCSYSSSIYVTIRNTGEAAYEGNFYITSSSSTTNKQNFFIYNHTYKADYEDSTYVSESAGYGYYQPPVEDKDLNSHPVSGLADGERFIIGPTPTGGKWDSRPKQIAIYNADTDTWSFKIPSEGTIVYVKDEDRFYRYNGNNWILESGGVSGALDWQESVIDKDLSSPPASGNTEGDRYIVGSTPTGGWASQANNIAEYIDIAWVFTVVNEGMACWVEDENKIYVYNGTSWGELGTVLTTIQDTDADTKVQTEESSDEDKIRFDTAGTERMILDSIALQINVNINANYNKVINLADPTTSRDAATKGYVDEHINIEDLWDRTSGGTTITPMNANDNLNLGSGIFTTTGTYNLLSLTSLATGFRISGGTTNKILTLNDDITSSNLVDSVSVPLFISSGNISLHYNTLNFELDSAQQLTIKESGIDHGSITGLADNDHTQYVNAIGGLPLTLSGQIITFNFDNTDFQVVGNNLKIRDEAIDHGTTSGLLDNDHTQYLLASGLSIPLTVSNQILTLNYDLTDFQLSGNQLQISDGGINHSNLSNLSADSHTQYYNLSRLETWLNTIELDRLNNVTIESGVTINQVLTWIGSRWSNRNIDHGNIVGLLDDDHTQYLTTTRADNWFLNKNISSLNDVDIGSGVIVGQLLRWDGSRWHNWTANYALSSELDTITLDSLYDVNVGSAITTGQRLKWDGNNWVNVIDQSTIEFIIDGGGSAITTGVKGDLEVPFNCTIVTCTMLADQSGSIQVDIWKDTFGNFPPTDADSITASAVPAIGSTTKFQSSTLTGWTTSLTKGNILRYNVDSITTITRCTISLLVNRS